MSDGRGEPDVPRPENSAHTEGMDPHATDHAGGEHASSASPGTTPGADGGYTDPTPGQDGIIVQGGREAPDSHGSAQSIGPKQDDPRAIGPKQDDPRAIGPKQDDPRAVGDGIIVQGGRTGHPEKKSHQKRAKKKMKTMALIIGGVMVVALGGVIIGRQLGHEPATALPQATATPTSAPSADAPGAPAPSVSSDSSSPAPVPSGSAPAAEVDPPTPAASNPPARSGSSASPVRTTQPAQPGQSSTPAPAAPPVLTLSPTSVQEYCANGGWPNTLVVRNSGGGNLNWSVGQLPAGVTISQGGGSLAAHASQVITLGGRAEQPPANGRFTIGISSNGGSGQVTVNCA
ncbi:hypothetical protein ACFVYT_15905 [Streptomyces sp. NPDC058290]|uniref:hypothetical protein n=1 Tax=Streptomyces sp. NPDC058290 TaxID=3346426 RepID=UPI0036EFF92D